MIKQGKIKISWSNDTVVNLPFETREYTDQFELVRLNDRTIYKNNMKIDYYRNNNLDKEFNILENFDHLKNKSYVVHKMPSGYILPFHSDLYPTYKKIYNVDNLDKIERIIVFLKDWSWGHILQVGDVFLSGWKAGDWISWSGSVPHLAANLGKDPRYTLQVTGHY
jgi:hypothetical protein